MYKGKGTNKKFLVDAWSRNRDDLHDTDPETTLTES